LYVCRCRQPVSSTPNGPPHGKWALDRIVIGIKIESRHSNAVLKISAERDPGLRHGQIPSALSMSLVLHAGEVQPWTLFSVNPRGKFFN